MKKTLELTLKQAQEIYMSADDSLKIILEENFGKKNFIKSPIGVWCLTSDHKAIKAEDWKESYKPIGVGVITEDTSFIVHLEPQAALPFGSTDVENYDKIVYYTDTYDNESATKAIMHAHDGVKGRMWNNDKFPFLGSPAAAYCEKCCGSLPTLATAKEIAKYIKEINEAMLAVGGAVVCGWLWTSTIKEDNDCAFVVGMLYGYVNIGYRNINIYARAVSAFHFEDFEF